MNRLGRVMLNRTPYYHLVLRVALGVRSLNTPPFQPRRAVTFRWSLAAVLVRAHQGGGRRSCSYSATVPCWWTTYSLIDRRAANSAPSITNESEFLAATV